MKTIQDILALVEKPSRYLGSEINRARKAHETVDLRMALAFPDLYEIGTSHFGIQILYHILNGHSDILAERVFAPATDMEAHLRASHLPLTSLESGVPIANFDIIGFSLLYELNFTNVLTMLDLANIPFLASQRDERFPLIIAGGPCTCNPEPVADFFDVIVVGDGEAVIVEIAQAWLQWKAGETGDKESLLKTWSRIGGVYVPAFFKPEFDAKGFQTLSPQFPDYTKVTRRIVGDLDDAPFPDTPIVPYGNPVHDRLRLEISRGCTRGCRFCQAGMIYRPVRERSPETLLSLADTSLAATGYEDMSLLSLSTGDYASIVPLMQALMTRCEAERTAISFPSLRAGTLTPELMALIKKVRKTGFTIAPEAGSQRLRDVINKNITEADIFETVNDAFSLGWQAAKLYFMSGLPTETDADLQAIVDLVKELRKIRGPKGRKGKINVSVGTFIPKSHTPFQWAAQISLAESKDKIHWLQDRLRMPGLHFKWQSPEVSLLEGLWARGDRQLSSLLISAYEKGCKFDGWSDSFQYPLWTEAFSDTGTDPDFYTTRAMDMAEPLPWDHIDTGITKDFLREEWEKAVHGENTLDCRNGDCNECGVCDFESIEPMVFEDSWILKSETRNLQPETQFKKFKVSYSKQDQARYFGHLELANIFSRAIRRAGIRIKYSEGFHPMPKISFEDPLPLGMESLNESLYLTVPGSTRPRDVLDGLKAQLPEGLAVHGCELSPGKKGREKFDPSVYSVEINHGFFDENELKGFNERSEFILTRTNRKGKQRQTDLRQAVLDIELKGPSQLEMKLLSEPGKSIRPAKAIKAIFGLSDQQVRLARIVKLR
ncbi:MAG: B12-binding domain-containing radical SAM protein [Desulfobacteraceae bacterium 4572_88]|nr:MAG: B12-binding domain-containing radical SAM protein [Desulfobacteraceae bacterium 4572_88]